MEQVDRQISAFRKTLAESWAWLANNSLDILGGLIAAALLVFLLLAVRSFGAWLGREQGISTLRLVVSRVIRKTHLWFMIALAALVVVEVAAIPPAASNATHFLFTVAAALQGAIWLRELVLGWVEHRAAAGGDEEGSLASALGIIRLLVSIAAFALAAILILDNLGVNVTALVAGLGIGGIAIGLAAQGIFSDLFAALSILFDKPFKKGDPIGWDTSVGTVEAIGLKTTRVRALTGERIIISNANLLNKEVRNMDRLERRRISFTLGVIYQTPVEMLEKLPNLLREIVDRHDKCLFVRSSFLNFNASSLDFELLFDVLSENYDEVTALRSLVGFDIIRMFAKNGFEFAYPTQTTFTAAPDGTMVLPYPESGLVMQLDKNEAAT